MKVKLGDARGGKRRVEVLHDTVSDEIVVRVYESEKNAGFSDARLEAAVVRQKCRGKRERKRT